MDTRHHVSWSKAGAHRIGKAALCTVLALSLLAAAAPVSIGKADPNRYLNDIKTLAAPNMEGRGPGTKGWCAPRSTSSTVQGARVTAAGTEGYLQPFTVTTGAKLKADN